MTGRLPFRPPDGYGPHWFVVVHRVPGQRPQVITTWPATTREHALQVLEQTRHGIRGKVAQANYRIARLTLEDVTDGN